MAREMGHSARSVTTLIQDFNTTLWWAESGSVDTIFVKQFMDWG